MTLYADPVPHQQVAGATPVRTDVYPATVQFSFWTNPYAKTRAILTADRALILVDGGNGSGAAVLYEGRLEDVAIPDRRHVVATTAEGEITISRAGGCGCGSRLRGYRPFARVVRMEKLPA
jgi:hypothetical protein